MLANFVKLIPSQEVDVLAVGAKEEADVALPSIWIFA